MQTGTNVLTSAADLAALEDEWNALLDDSAQSSFNMRPLWLLAWWRYFAPPGAQLRTIVCRDGDGVLTGLAPLYFDPAGREIRFIGVGLDDTPANLAAAIIARRGHEAGVAAAVAGALVEDREWTRLWLARMRPELQTAPLLAAALGGAARPNAENGDNLYLPVSGGWDAYRESLGRAGRRIIRSYACRAIERGFTFRRAASGEELERAFALYLRWHAQVFGGEGVYTHAPHATFLHEVVMKGFAERRVRVWLAELHGTITAVDMAFVDNGVVKPFQGHPDPAYSAMRLGHVMTAHVLRDCFEDPDIDEVILGARATHKLHWTTQWWGTSDLIHERREWGT